MDKEMTNYTVLMAQETDLYTAPITTPNNQVGYELAFSADDRSSNINNSSSRLTEESSISDIDHTRNPEFHQTHVRLPNSNELRKYEVQLSDPFHEHGLRYGWKCISNKLLQRCNKPAFFLIWLCFSGAAQGLIRTGITFTVLTSIERQFGFSSSELAFISVIYDIAYGICTIFVGYVGHLHKPRYIGWGLLILAIGAATNAVPKFMIGPYTAGVQQSSDFCRTGEGSYSKELCVESTEWYYKFIFILASILLGIGATPIYTLAPAHIDEVTERGQGSLYMGIFYSACAIGPALGFMIGMPVLNTYVDLEQPANSTLTPSDTNWVGAWWLGFLLGAGLALIPVIPMLGFPKLFPNSESLRATKLQLEDTLQENRELKHDLKSVWPATKALLTNSPFVLISLSVAAEGLATGGFATFLPKFVETQFHFTASNSALYTGIIVIPGAAGGIFLGGYLGKRFKWNCKETLRFATIMAFLATLCCAFALVGCDGRDVVGQENNGTALFMNQCNSKCRCSAEFYKPICTVKDQQTYYSPCYAGCHKHNSVGNDFYNCSCFPTNVNHAIDGPCTSECNLFPLFVLGAFLLLFFTFMNNVPMLNATFRVVNDGQGSFAMGFQQIFVRFLGFIPAPIMFGIVIDKSCKLWQTDGCSKENTSCSEYNHSYFRFYMFALTFICKLASFILIFWAYKIYELPQKKPPSLPENDITNPTYKSGNHL